MNVLHDAIKEKSGLRGRALLRWDFKGGEFPGQSLNMPEPVVDQILKWRDRDREAEVVK